MFTLRFELKLCLRVNESPRVQEILNCKLFNFFHNYQILQASYTTIYNKIIDEKKIILIRHTNIKLIYSWQLPTGFSVLYYDV